MSKALFMKNLRAHWKLVLLFALVLVMYLSIIAGMFDPASPGMMSQLESFNMSPELLAAFGFDAPNTDLAGFLAGYFYGMLMLGFPLVLYGILGNKLVSSMVEKGSMAAVLASPMKRTRAALTQGVFLLSAVSFLVLVVTLAGLAVAGARFPGLLDMRAFVQMNLGVLTLHAALSGVTFFASCLFSDTRWSLALGSGLPVFFLLAHMLGNTGEKLHALRFLTPFSLYDAMDFVEGLPVLPQTLILLFSAIILYTAGVLVFNRKDLAL